MTERVSTLERLLQRDRLLTLLALLATSMLAWAYLAAGFDMTPASMPMPSMPMPGMPMPGMAMTSGWSAAYFGVMAVMWVLMMVAMMLPSATPMVLLFATIERRRRAVSPFPATAQFALAYLVLWSSFGLLATALQWQLDRLVLLTPTMAVTGTVVTGILLLAAGLYQFTPLKQACLRGCRSPLEFLSQHWHRGPFGLGLTHGLYCIGCCWMLMLLLFVVGVTNLRWVAIIAAFILVEKVAPRGNWVGYFVGAALIVAGLWQLGAGLLL
jgi:predicted metal-binding membrane protein